MNFNDETFENELYNAANDEIDIQVFRRQELLDVYNDWPDDEARDLLYDIADDAVREAKEVALRRVTGVVESRKGELVKLLKQKWACPDCSDQFEGTFVMLEHESDGSWTCPKCGCSTFDPEEDACYDMSDWKEN